VTDPTGPELLDALERLYASVSLHSDIICALQTGEASRITDMVNEVIMAWGETPSDAIARLRSLLRTPKEAAVLRAAFHSYAARKRILKEGLSAFEASTAAEMALFDALDALPPERRAALMKEDSR
jgi:DNA-directed RNA polymerase specialized sigma24 family protein